MSVYNNYILCVSDINELNLPKTCQVDFPDPDDLLTFKLIICPDEVSGRLFIFSARLNSQRNSSKVYRLFHVSFYVCQLISFRGMQTEIQVYVMCCCSGFRMTLKFWGSLWPFRISRSCYFNEEGQQKKRNNNNNNNNNNDFISIALFHVKHAQLRCTMPMNNTHACAHMRTS